MTTTEGHRPRTVPPAQPGWALVTIVHRRGDLQHLSAAAGIRIPTQEIDDANTPIAFRVNRGTVLRNVRVIAVDQHNGTPTHWTSNGDTDLTAYGRLWTTEWVCRPRRCSQSLASAGQSHFASVPNSGAMASSCCDQRRSAQDQCSGAR
jgi:hypothetical protein